MRIFFLHCSVKDHKMVTQQKLKQILNISFHEILGPLFIKIYHHIPQRMHIEAFGCVHTILIYYCAIYIHHTLPLHSQIISILFLILKHIRIPLTLQVSTQMTELLCHQEHMILKHVHQVPDKILKKYLSITVAD